MSALASRITYLTAICIARFLYVLPINSHNDMSGQNPLSIRIVKIKSWSWSWLGFWSLGALVLVLLEQNLKVSVLVLLIRSWSCHKSLADITALIYLNERGNEVLTFSCSSFDIDLSLVLISDRFSELGMLRNYDEGSTITLVKIKFI